MTLHELCLQSLNTEITQALVCGKRIHQGELKDLIITFGALHLFVVSGAHLYFWANILSFLNTPLLWKRLFLTALVCTCDFSAPILRAFTQIQINIQRKLHVPKSLTPLLAMLLCSLIALFKSELFSLCLSFSFAVLISIGKRKSSKQFLIFSLALPIFIASLGLPHHSSILLTPALGALLLLLMPLSFLALFSTYAEFTAAKIWWMLESFLKDLHVFYNFPKKPTASFEIESILITLAYSLLLNLIIYFMEVLWNRKSFSLYFS